jgi:hypothetical protein
VVWHFRREKVDWVRACGLRVLAYYAARVRVPQNASRELVLSRRVSTGS